MAATATKPKTEEPEPVVADDEPVEIDDDATGRSIYQRMIAVLAELPAIGKNTRNTDQNFNFRSHDDVLNALNPLLAKHGIVVVPDVIERVASDARRTARDKTMYEVNLHVRFTFYGPAGDSIVASVWGEGTDMGDKATNKAMTMAFKNVLAQAFAVSTAETVDSDSESPEETTSGRPAQVEAAPDDRVDHLQALASSLDIKPSEIEGKLDAARASNFGELSPAYVEGQIETLEKKVADRKARATKTVESLIGDVEAGGLMAPGDRHWFDYFHVRTPIADLTLDQARQVVTVLKKPGADSETLAVALDAIIGPEREKPAV
jgi:hypothetical protein